MAGQSCSLFVQFSPLSSVVVEESKRDFFFHLYLNILARTVNHTENVVEQLSDQDGPWMVRVAHVGCFCSAWRQLSQDKFLRCESLS
jgi:hypothetical protein